MLQQTMAVFLVLGLLLLALWLLKRKGAATFHFALTALQNGGPIRPGRKLRAGKKMCVLERIVLTPQHSLHLVSIENRLVLFAVSPAGCQAVPSPGWRADLDPGHETSLADSSGKEDSFCKEDASWKEAASC